MKTREGFALIEQLAKLLGGSVGATRAAVEANIAPASIQIGQTGKTVTPKMYALATIIFFVTLSLLLLNNLIDNDDSRKLQAEKKRRRRA